MQVLLPIAGLPAWPFSTFPNGEQPRDSATLTIGDDGLYDIYGPLKLSEFPFVPTILGVIAVLCLLALFLYLRRRKRPGPVPLSAGAQAMAELNAIQALIDQPLVYMEKISDILRRYLETRFSITSTSRTTGELLLALRQDNLPDGARLIDSFGPDLTACLEYSDRAKFAHLLPDRNRMLAIQATVRTFIEQSENTPHGEGQN